MATLTVKMRGPNRYCPDCGRWLVRISEDGRFDLAAKASVHASEAIPAPFDEVVWVSAIDAVCLLCTPEEGV